jgi:hypothetical protein
MRFIVFFFIFVFMYFFTLKPEEFRFVTNLND